MSALIKPDPKLDLVLERVVDVPRELVFKAWTTPEHLKHWFVPKPWTVTECEIDLRRGGVFRSVMRSPEGQEFTNVGCYLDIIPNELLVFTDALLPGYRPSEKPFFTATLNCSIRARAPATSPPPCTAIRKAASSMRRWVSMMGGARSSPRWSNT